MNPKIKIYIHFAGPKELFSTGAFDSLSAVELSNVIASTVGVNLPSTLVFDYPSILTLAGYVHNLLDDSFSSDTAQRHSIGLMPSHHVAPDCSLQVCLMKYALMLQYKCY